MRTAQFFISIVSLGAVVLSCYPLEAQTPTPDGLVRTRQQKFAIPFRIDDVANAADLPAEVRLNVSDDRGATWRVEGRWRKDDRRDYRVRQFAFRAPRDGEYWFKVQATDSNGQLSPASRQADLRVLVDTVQPSLTLSARPSGSAVEVDWRFDDPNLDATTFRIQYQVADGGPWQPVPRAAIQIPAVDPNQPHRRSGSARWNTAVAGGNISVMAMVSDACGNRAIVKQMVQVSSENPSPVGPNVARPLAAQPQQQFQPGQQPQQGTLRQNSGQHRFTTDRGAHQGYATQGQTGPMQGGRYSPLPARQQTTQQVPQQGAPHLPPPLADGSARWPANHTAQRPLTGRQGVNARTNGPQPAANEVARNSQPFMTPVARSQDRSAHFSNRGAGGYGSHNNPAQPLAPQVQTPAAVASHAVNSNSFALDYEIDTTSASGVARVELWMTQDGGNSWQFLMTDNDRRSPVLVTVDRDGHYGFQIVIDDVNGRGDPRPKSGDAPQMAVTIDRQAPLVQLIAAEPDMTSSPARMRIRWQAHDQRLANRPISLHYSDRPDGEWFVIAAQLDNRGEYIWQLPDVVPAEIYIRLAARDAAGNEGKTVTPTSVVLQRTRPRGTLRGVRPSAPAAPAMPRDAASPIGPTLPAQTPATQPRAAQTPATPSYTPPIN